MAPTRFVISFCLFALAGTAADAQNLYHPKCCPKLDCRPARPGEVRLMPDGYHIDGLAKVYASRDRRVMISADERFHVCIRSAATPAMEMSRAYAQMESKKLKCLYIPAIF